MLYPHTVLVKDWRLIGEDKLRVRCLNVKVEWWITVWNWNKMHTFPMKSSVLKKSKTTCSRSGTIFLQPCQQMTAQTVWIGRWCWRQRSRQENQSVLTLPSPLANFSAGSTLTTNIKRKPLVTESLQIPSHSSSRKRTQKYGCQRRQVTDKLMWNSGSSGCTDSRSPAFDQVNGYDGFSYRREAALSVRLHV